MCPKCGMTTKCGKIFQGKKCLRSFTGKNQHGVKICCTYMASVYTSKKTNCTWHKWLTMTLKYCLQTRYWFTILLLNVVITAVHFLQGKICNKKKTQWLRHHLHHNTLRLIRVWIPACDPFLLFSLNPLVLLIWESHLWSSRSEVTRHLRFHFNQCNIFLFNNIFLLYFEIILW